MRMPKKLNKLEVYKKRRLKMFTMKRRLEENKNVS
uniref:Uncharacterized protein n=1 Tax=Cucumis melo TaxID=3656 RepID=A0A9I9E1R7_CUCME